ncbi:hypothetical protein [Actinokineospora sp.]|uniref:hypothetical protein n=1 Tax=Actinokineospora sp. TaxID=1872133 RepID=UPI004037F01F
MSTVPSRVIRIYHPWPAPVQAARYSDPGALPEIRLWVTSLRAQGRIAPDVDFTIHRSQGVEVGLLRDRSGAHELPPSAFLVFGRDGLRVLDAHAFWRQYHDPGGLDHCAN